jgi:surfactin synthase thioesterase subunit
MMLVDSMRPALPADIGMCQTYRAGSGRPALRSPVHVMAGEQDAGVPISSTLEWKAVAGGDFSARTVPGGHLFHQDEPETTVRAVLEVIEAS